MTFSLLSVNFVVYEVAIFSFRTNLVKEKRLFRKSLIIPRQYLRNLYGLNFTLRFLNAFGVDLCQMINKYLISFSLSWHPLFRTTFIEDAVLNRFLHHSLYLIKWLYQCRLWCESPTLVIYIYYFCVNTNNTVIMKLSLHN